MGTATTYDGREVDTFSEEWRAHCEATTCLAMPLNSRKAHIQNVLGRRGAVARQALEDLIGKMWMERQVQQLLKMTSDGERIVHLTRLERATNSRMRGDIEKILEGRLTASLF